MADAGSGRMTAGGAIFARLKALGVDYVFCNSGTDFPPIIEGLAQAAAQGIELPAAITVPHEHAAMGMAHGYYHATGRAQAVMLHTNVGLANAAAGAINAATDGVPVLMMSGRTPVTEAGRFGARTVPIGWGQEMRDQAALVREAVKWDYELRFPEQICALLDRAHAIACSTPRGPIYLSLPREVLCQEIDGAALDGLPTQAPARAAARADDIDRLAGWIAEVERPLILCQRGAGSAEGFSALTTLVADWAIPVCHYWATALAIPSGHPMEIGGDPKNWLAEADLVLVVDALAPWMPDAHAPRPETRVAHLGPDPLFARTPVRGFPADLALPGETAETVARLGAALAPHRKGAAKRVAARRRRVAAASEKIRASEIAKAEAGCRAPMSKHWVALCLSRAIQRAARRATVVSELGSPLAGMALDHWNAWRQEPYSGGLGYGLPAALGHQLADPDALVFASIGDGSYMFANPTVCHQLAEALALPVVTLVINNEEWGAVRHSVAGLYPKGYAARANQMPLTALQPSPDFCKTAEASRAHAETIERGEDLPAALDRAIAVATSERRQALLNIKIDKGSAF